MGASRRRALILQNAQQDTINYIQDGLIFQLDADDYSGGNSISVRIPETTGEVNGFTKQGKGIHSTNYSGTYIKIPDSIGLIDTTDKTLEVCVRKNATGNYSNIIVVFEGSTAPLILFHTNDNYIRVNAGSGTAIKTIVGNTSNGFYTISCNYEDSIVNGKQVTMGTCGSQSGQSRPEDGYIWVGNGYPANNWNFGFIGDIYSIRLYNRKLTTSERLHNQRVDNYRFKN